MCRTLLFSFEFYRSPWNSFWFEGSRCRSMYMYAHWCTCKLISLVGRGGSGSSTKKKKTTATWRALDHVQILLFSLLVFHRIAKHTGLDWSPHYHLVCSLSSYPLECTFESLILFCICCSINISTSSFHIPGAYLPPSPCPYHLVIFSFISLLSLCQAARVFACVRPFTPALKPDLSNLSYLFHLWPHPTHNTVWFQIGFTIFTLDGYFERRQKVWWIPNCPLSMEHAWEATTTHYYLVFIHPCLWLYKNVSGEK